MTISSVDNVRFRSSIGIDADLAFIDHEVSRRLFGASRRRIGRYPLLEVLGSGGMGLVYLAADDHLQRRVAIKLLSSESHTPEGMERLLREARAMARLSHPCVVQVYEAGVEAGQIFIAMEYIEGATLREWTANARPWRAVREMFVAIGKGVLAAHAVGIVHRDLKPGNILIDTEGRPKVADFGLARKETEQAGEFVSPTVPDLNMASIGDLTLPGAQVGTPRYMSPEQHRGDSVSFASDQYSFCVVMWEALYRQYPFAGADDDALRVAKATGEVMSPPASARIPAILRRALLRGLRPDPADRWPSMAALVAELERDPWPRRLPWVMAFAGLLVAPAVFIAQAWMTEAPGATCTATAVTRVSTVWNDDVRQSLASHLTGADDESSIVAAWEVLAPELDRYAEDLKRARGSLCVETAGTVRYGEQDLAALVWRDTCLEHRLLAFSGYLEALGRLSPDSSLAGTTAAFFDPGVAPRDIGPALGTKLRLPAIAACERAVQPRAADAGASPVRWPGTPAPVRARIAALARVQALETLGHDMLARTELERLLPALRTEGPADLLPEHEYLHGRLLRRVGRDEAARAALYRAEQRAERSWRDDLLIAIRLELAMVDLEARATLRHDERSAQPRTAEREYDRAVAIMLRNGGAPGEDLEFMRIEALIADHGGDDEAGVLRARVAERIREDAPSGSIGVQLLAQFATDYARAGLHDSAMALDREALEYAQNALGTDAVLTADVAYNAALRLLVAEDAVLRPQGLEDLELAMHAYRTAPNAGLRHGMAEHAAASALLHAGESELAWPYAQRAFTLVREQPDRLGLVFSLHLQCMIQLRRRDPVAAYKAGDEALRILAGLPPTEAVRTWGWQIKVHLMEALLYQGRGAEAVERGASLRRAMGPAKPTALSAELSLRQAQAAFAVGEYRTAVEFLGSGSGHLCDALQDRLAIGDAHALSAQIRRAKGQWELGSEHWRIAKRRYGEAGSDGKDRQETGLPWPRRPQGLAALSVSVPEKQDARLRASK